MIGGTNKMITQVELKRILKYDKNTGFFTWNISKKGVRKNSRAGSIINGYEQIVINKKNYLSHRLAFLYMEGYLPENEIDHINRVRNDNRWENLREVSRKCNSRNCNISKNNTSGITGVYLDRINNKWRSAIMVDGITKDLGRYINLDDAVMARYTAEIKYGWYLCDQKTPASSYLFEKGLI